METDVVEKKVIIRSSTKMKLICNPDILLLSTINKIDRLYQRLEYGTGASVGDCETYLREREPRLWSEIDKAWQSVDTDIFRLYLEGNLSEADMRSWQNHLRKWYQSLRAAIELYRLHLANFVESDVFLHVKAA